jgi:hypothetical protein
VTRVRCRSKSSALSLQNVLELEYPDAITTRTGRTIRTELTERDIARVRYVP